MAEKEPMVSRTIRVQEPLWTAAQSKAEAHNENVSTVIRRLLTRYVSEPTREDT